MLIRVTAYTIQAKCTGTKWTKVITRYGFSMKKAMQKAAQFEADGLTAQVHAFAARPVTSNPFQPIDSCCSTCFTPLNRVVVKKPKWKLGWYKVNDTSMMLKEVDDYFQTVRVTKTVLHMPIIRGIFEWIQDRSGCKRV